jgi:hypothetical protein
VCSPGKKNEVKNVKIIAKKQRIPKNEEKYHMAGLLAYNLVCR